MIWPGQGLKLDGHWLKPLLLWLARADCYLELSSQLGDLVTLFSKVCIVSLRKIQARRVDKVLHGTVSSIEREENTQATANSPKVHLMLRWLLAFTGWRWVISVQFEMANIWPLLITCSEVIISWSPSEQICREAWIHGAGTTVRNKRSCCHQGKLIICLSLFTLPSWSESVKHHFSAAPASPK